MRPVPQQGENFDPVPPYDKERSSKTRGKVQQGWVDGIELDLKSPQMMSVL